MRPTCAPMRPRSGSSSCTGPPASRRVPALGGGASWPNTSGAPGVYFMRSVVKGTAYFFWQARAPDLGKRCKTRSFSISKYGNDLAYALAVKARAEFVAEVKGYAVVNRIPEKFRPRA